MSAICDAHKKKVDVELLYNSVQRKFNQLEIRCGRENQHLAEWAPRPSVEQPRRTEKKRGYGHKSGSPTLSLSLSHSKTFNNPFETFQIKCEEYFSKRLCCSSLLCRR